ncbi:TNF receptor-associated factor 6-like [Xenia sp. Carnegie-2017]|uniref:TNF receptor-associated factor 6-like n=1 Tax=Xenia sp. Carnegie-2017 TaxID=2897299 RepID=UPI001F03CCD5|nr:TNF receptor-associated factor 6-like [Xenia sp. Carnegie-2017]
MKIEKKIHPKFICTYCHHLLVNPMQTSCGHLFCESCIDIVLGCSDPRCPEDEQELNQNEVFPDAFARRELRTIRLHCPSNNCNWFGTYEELEGHSQVCEHALISCVHKQCNIQLHRSLLDEHLKNDCEYRNVKCEYCGKDVPYDSLKDHLDNICDNAPVPCKYCKQLIQRKNIENHENTTCDEVPTECEFQAIGCNHNKTLKRREIQQHMKDNLIDHVSLLLRYVIAIVTQLSNYVPPSEFSICGEGMADRPNAVRANLSEKLVMLEGKLTDLKKTIDNLKRRDGNDRDAQLYEAVFSIRERIMSLSDK